MTKITRENTASRQGHQVLEIPVVVTNAATDFLGAGLCGASRDRGCITGYEAYLVVDASASFTARAAKQRRSACPKPA